ARRLVEAGARVVTLAYGRWDWHGKPHGTTFENARHHLPMLDTGLTALIEDLEERGLSDDVSVVVWGEFGRTPKINPQGGRDHWPDCFSVVLAGGGVRGGAVYGASDDWGAYPASDPVTPADLAATLFWRFGIDPASEMRDQTGR